MKQLKKIYDLLTVSDRKTAFFLIILIFIMALLDMFGIASIVPFISLISTPKIIESNFMLIYLYKIAREVGVTNTQQFLYLFGWSVFILLITSLIFRGFIVYLQTRFALMREYSIGKRLIEAYLRQPYSWFLHQHSANLTKNILSVVNQVIYNSIIPLINVIVYGFISLSILILILLVNLVLSLCIILCLAIVFGVIIFFMRRLLTKIGSDHMQANKERFILVNESFAAIKEIKIKGLENFYLNRFSKPALIYAKNQAAADVIGQLPRYFIEAIAFGGIIIIILFLMSSGTSFMEIVPIIALYVFAGYRLMPALQSVYFGISQMRFSQSALNSLHQDLINLKFDEQKINDLKDFNFKHSIELKKIFFTYPNSNRPFLINLNLTIPVYSKIGLIGPSGSGKTTIIDLILGLLKAEKGSLYVDGKPITAKNVYSWQKIIGYVPQQIYLSNTSIKKNIAFGVVDANIDQDTVQNAAKIANLHNFITTELPEGYNTIVGERGVNFSGGQRQRIGIARAFYNKPKLLILDEATSALDNLTEEAVMTEIMSLKSNITIIVISHRLSILKDCDIIFTVKDGVIKKLSNYDNSLS
jgi:ABC-type multidrug transport system fused ATPase/permease subunit